MLNTIVNTQEWIIGMDPDESDTYMVTFLVTWENGKKWRGIDLLEFERIITEGIWEPDEKTWYTEKLEKRFPSAQSIKVVAWMPLPEVCEED